METLGVGILCNANKERELFLAPLTRTTKLVLRGMLGMSGASIDRRKPWTEDRLGLLGLHGRRLAADGLTVPVVGVRLTHLGKDSMGSSPQHCDNQSH
jgi:hypothetical protein